VPLGNLLGSPRCLLIVGEVSTEEPDLARVQFSDTLHPVQQRPVVADQQQDPGPLLQDRVQAVPGVDVEVVGGLVEQQDVGATQQVGGQPKGDDLAAAESVQSAVEGEFTEPDPVQLGAAALLDVPVVADRGEVFLTSITGFDGVQSGDGSGDAEHLRGGQGTGQRQVLRQIAEGAGNGDGTGGGREFAGDQPKQGGLADAVGRDQAGVPGADGKGKVLEDGGAVGPGEGQAGADD